MSAIFLVQIICTLIFIKCQRRNIRKYIYSLINEINFPPKRKSIIEDSSLSNKRSRNNNTLNSDKKSINEKITKLGDKIKDKKKNINTEMREQLTEGVILNRRNITAAKKEKNKYTTKASIPTQYKKSKFSNQNKNILNTINLIDSGNEKGPYDHSSERKLKNLKKFGNNESRYKTKELLITSTSDKKSLFVKNNKKALILNSDDEKGGNHAILEDGVVKKIKDIKELKRKMKKDILYKIKKRQNLQKEKEERKKEVFVTYEHKEFNDKEINELDFEEAITYDKRSFFQIFCSNLKEKQVIINTFCSKDPYRPFSIKLLVMNFSFSCYFVINGFLYNEEYVSAKLTSEESKSFSGYLSDSIERILFTSIVGGLISFIIGILFNTEKKIEDATEKHQDNKILLKGEIAKIYKCSNLLINCFLLVEFFCMIFFTVYIFCFCYVYPNNNIDWIESSLIVIGIMQFFSIFTSFLISFLKFLSVKCQWELCFKINAYLEEKL